MQEFELAVGDTLCVGEYTITILEIEEQEISVQIDGDHLTESQEFVIAGEDLQTLSSPVPK